LLELDDYKVSQLLNENPWVQTYRGVELRRQTSVILKVARGETPDARILARLRHDHELLTQLRGPGVIESVAMLEYGRSLVLVQKDPGGELLDTVGPMPYPLDAFFPLALSLIDVLERIHRHNVIHLDIKPSSIFFDRASGCAHLGDFGLASRLSREHPQPRRPEQIEGSLGYLSPEQTGLMNRAVDFRADYYALGMVLYQVLTGHFPFSGTNALEWVHCHLARPPRPPRDWVPEIPLALSAIVLKLLSKLPENRYRSVTGLRTDLQASRSSWERHEDTNIELGRADVSEQLQLPQKLYGRDREIRTLLAAFERVATTGRSELALLAGYPGIGKSVLVAELYRPIMNLRGRYLSGKFDQYKRGIPYAPFSEALRGLVQQLLADSPEQIAEWRTQIGGALRENGQVLSNMVPLMERLIGPQPALPALPPEQSQHRVHATVQRFISVFATPESPLVLFLDDLQWVDPASLSLLAHLVGGSGPSYFLLIGAYRDNEVESSHPLSVAIDELAHRGHRFSSITLAPLAKRDVRDILVDTLHSRSAGASALADLIYGKTAGNPFFTFQFITALSQDNLLRFDPYNRLWTWDVERIRLRGFTDNVVDLMIGELRRLPASTLAAVRLASFLGSQFDLKTLANLVQKNLVATRADLWPAQQVGLLIGRDGRYRFLHDRVQEAAYALTPPGERSATHLRIGRLMFEDTSDAELDERLFSIVAHVNHGVGEITSCAERLRYAHLNLRAGLKAQAAVAYPAACESLAKGIELLPEDSWRTVRALSYNLYLARAECEFLSGRFATADRLVEKILDVATDPLERARAYLIRTKLRITRGDTSGACESSQQSLLELGIELPLRPSAAQVRQAYEEIDSVVRERSLKVLLELPDVTNARMAMAIRLITSTSMAAFLTDQHLAALRDAHVVLLSLRYGNSDDAVMGYALYGFMLGAYLHRYRDGAAHTEMAYRLMERRGADHHRGKVIHTQGLVALWVKPLSDGIALHRRAIPPLLEVGDMIFACLALRFIVAYHFLRGDHLQMVEQEADRCRQFAEEKHFPVVTALNEATRRLVLSLRGIAGSPDAVTTDRLGTDQPTRTEAPKTELLDGTDRIPFVIVAEHLAEMTRSCIMGDHADAVGWLRQAEPLMWAIPGLLPSYDFYYYGSISLAADYSQQSPKEQTETLRRLKLNLEQLRIWADSNPQTFLHSHMLVSAEIARLESQSLLALQLYESAIAASVDGKFIQDEALANERAADCQRALGLERGACAQRRTAWNAYRRWGAEAKARRLEAEHPEILDAIAAATAGLDRKSLGRLDVLTVARAAQAISGEMVRENLLKTLLTITLEQAGADSAALLLTEEEKLTLAARAVATSSEVVFRIGDDSAGAPGLPHSVLNYVRHGREPLLLNDANALRPFASDAYLQQSPPACILCLPILFQDTLVGVLYLEHRHVAQRFTPSRRAVLEQLALQAATSLQNAQLYGRLEEYSHTLEEKVAERTEDLRVTVEDLQAFSATLSHDLQAPLRHLSGFADLLEKRCSTVLDRTAHRYLSVMRRSAQRMDQLIAKLLEFSRTSRAGMQVIPVDLNELAREVIEELRMDWGSRQLEWRIGAIPAVAGDRALLRSVITNLISNAIKYTRPRSLAVIELGQVQAPDSGNSAVTWYVRDNGVGFDPAYADKLFKDFQRLHDRNEFEGTGIGLVSVRRIVERHGGSAWAEGTPGQGATFYVMLPRFELQPDV
jgi:predicted ATPase/signal transduction histidine kinase